MCYNATQYRSDAYLWVCILDACALSMCLAAELGSTSTTARMQACRQHSHGTAVAATSHCRCRSHFFTHWVVGGVTVAEFMPTNCLALFCALLRRCAWLVQVFSCIILIELFGSPFMRNASLVLSLIIGLIVASAITVDGKVCAVCRMYDACIHLVCPYRELLPQRVAWHGSGVPHNAAFPAESTVAWGLHLQE